MNTIRSDQLKVIHQKYDPGKSNFQIIILKGETGIGKTYLIESFLESVRSEKVLISRSVCNYQTGKYEPYLPFKELLRGLIEIRLENEPDELNSNFFKKALVKSVKILVDVAPDLIETFVPAGNLLTKIGSSLFEGINIKDTVAEKLGEKGKKDYQIKEAQIHKQYLGFLRSLSQESPVILVLEDLQWLDESSMNFLLPLTQKLKDCPILFIGSYRSNEVTEGSGIFPILNELNRNLGDMELDMDLKDEESRQSMVNSILDEKKNGLGTEFRQKLLSITNGNPMFIHELMQSMAETRQIVADSEGVLQNNVSLNWDDIPKKLEAVVQGRLSKLGEDTRFLLSSASVQGVTFLLQVLGKTDQMNDKELLKIFAHSLTKKYKLLKEGKVERLNRQILSHFYFSNGLIQRYLYNDLTQSERMLYHQEIAEALIEIYKEECSQVNGLIAYHYEKAEIPEKAVIFYENAGMDAVRLSCFKEASLLFGKALYLIETLMEDNRTLWEPVKLRLLVKTSIALKPNEGWIGKKVIDLYNQAYEIGTRLNDYKTLAPVTFGLWVKHLLHLELEEALKLADSYLETAVKLHDSAMTLEAKICISNTYFWMGNVENSLKFADEVIDEFDENLHRDQIYEFGQDPRAFAYQFKILSDSLLSKGPESHELAKNALQWAKSLQHPFTEAIILQAIAWLYFQEGSSDTKEVCDHLIEISQKYDFGFYLGIGHILSACWLLEDQEFDEAIRRLNTGYFEYLNKDGGIMFHSVYHILKSRAELGQGRFEDSLNTIEKAIGTAKKQSELVYYPLLLNQKAGILAKLNQPEEANRIIQEANDYSKENKMFLFVH